MGNNSILSNLMDMKMRASRLIAKDQGLVEISDENGDQKTPEKAYSPAQSYSQLPEPPKQPKSYVEQLEKQLDKIVSDIPIFNESEIERLITEANSNKDEIVIIAANLGGEAGKFVLDKLLKEHCETDFERAHCSLAVKILTNDQDLQKYATEMRLKYLPKSMAQMEQTAHEK